MEIPEKLLNYLDNRYELQYRLYDYFYRNGYRDVKAVTIDGYEIDPEERKAEFTIRISKEKRGEEVYAGDLDHKMIKFLEASLYETMLHDLQP